MQIFMFNLPLSNLPDRFPYITSYLLRTVHRNGHHRRVFAKASRTVLGSAGILSESEKAALMARSQALTAGPSLVECKGTVPNGANSGEIFYGASVLARARSKPPGGWNQRIRFYHEGLAQGPWKLRPELEDFGIKQVRHEGDCRLQKFRCPATIIFGLQDAALDPRLALNGTEKYFAGCQDKENVTRDSHVIRLQSCGHWSFLEPMGADALEATLLWLLNSDASCDLPSRYTSLTRSAGLEDFLWATQKDLAGELTIETYRSHY